MPPEEARKVHLIAGLLNADNCEIVDFDFGQVEITSLVDEPENDTTSMRCLRNTDSMEFTISAKFEWSGKFGKKKLKWYRKHLGIDLLSKKFPKKNRRDKRLKRRMKNG